MALPPLESILDDFELLDGEDRYRLLIDLGRELEPMPDALKTDATKVRGCSASVWLYPTASEGRLHFLADSNAAITKGIVALVLSAVQDKPAAEVAALDVTAALAPFELVEAPQRQPHAGRAEHDRAREADGGALRRRLMVRPGVRDRARTDRLVACEDPVQTPADVRKILLLHCGSGRVCGDFLGDGVLDAVHGGLVDDVGAPQFQAQLDQAHRRRLRANAEELQGEVDSAMVLFVHDRWSRLPSGAGIMHSAFRCPQAVR